MTATSTVVNDVAYSVTDVRHTYGTGTHALQDVTISLPRGSVTSLIGPSGCGKSTLLNILSGLLQPSEGRVEIFGRELDGPPVEVSHMFQKATLLPWRTVLENVLLPLELRDGKKAARKQKSKARDLLKLVGIADFEAGYPHQLSGGMAQRAAICRMLVTEPQILLLDEPFGALDELTRERMDSELLRIVRSTGATAVLVTHSIPESVFLSDVVYAMSARPGRITRAIEIDLPHPRGEHTLAHPRYLELVNTVRQALDEGYSRGAHT